METPLIIRELDKLGYEVYHTGSRYICDNPPPDSDDDWLVLAEGIGIPYSLLSEHGFTRPRDDADMPISGDETTIPYYSEDEKVNLILVSSEWMFDAWVKATDEARRLHLKSRDERVELFRRIRAEAEAEHYRNTGIYRFERAHS